MITQRSVPKRILLTTLLMLAVAAGTVTGWAQEAPVSQQTAPETLGSERSAEIPPFMLRAQYVKPELLAGTLGMLGFNCTAAGLSNAIIVSDAMTGEEAARARAAVASLDVPQPSEKNLEIIFHFLMAVQDGQPAGLRPCPPGLATTVKHLQEMLGLTDFGVLDTVPVRGRDGGEIISTGFLPEIAGVNEKSTARYTVGANRIEVCPQAGGPAWILMTGVKGTTENLANLSQAGPSKACTNNGFSSDVDVKEGQATVLGKFSLSPGGESVYVVVSAQVVPE
jgi:hypothetical protein